MEKSEPTESREVVVERLIAEAVEFAAALDRRRNPRKDREAVTDLVVRLTRLMTIASPRALRRHTNELTRHLMASFGGDPAAVEFLSATLADLGRLTPPRRPSRLKPPPRPVARRGEFGLRYTVVKTPDGEALAEQREGEMAAGKRKGFRVPRSDYDAAVKALATATEPIKFNDLHRRFINAGGQDLASQYGLRTILRFWRLHAPPLVKKERARYTPVDHARFEKDAARAWKDAREPK